VRAEHAARFALRREALDASRAELLRLHRAQEIGDDALSVLERELDLEEVKLRSQVAG
jgi:CPA1 family monovalent cation:H+ antiporter